MSTLLRAVTRAASRRTTTEQAFRASLRAAVDGGHSLREVGQAAGLSYEGVRYLLHPDPRKNERR